MTVKEGGIYTIVETKTVDNVVWGRLKSGAGLDRFRRNTSKKI